MQALFTLLLLLTLTGCPAPLPEYVIEDCVHEVQPYVVVQESDAFSCYGHIKINFTTSEVLNAPAERIQVSCERAGFLMSVQEINDLRACLLRNFALINGV